MALPVTDSNDDPEEEVSIKNRVFLAIRLASGFERTPVRRHSARASMTAELQQTREAPFISVVFVHGTWAGGSTWPQLEAHIRRAFAPAEVAIHHLKWSGRNTVSARLSAAETLTQFLRADLAHRPTARRFVVGHSHGGTVALFGLRDVARRQSVDGVICLSTPFLLVRPRRLSELGSSLVSFGLVMTVAVVTVAAALFTRSIVPLIVGPAAAWAIRVAAVRGASRSQPFIERVSLPDVTGLPLLIVRAPDDEASLSLGLLQATTRLLWLVWRVLGLHWVALLWNAALRLADRVGVRAVVERLAELWIVAVISAVVTAALFQKYTSSDFPSYLAVIAFAPVLLMVVTILVAALLIVPIGIINALALLPFGPGFAIFSPFIEVSAEATPSGASMVVQLSWSSRPMISETTSQYAVRDSSWMGRTVSAALGFWNQIASSAIRLQHSETYSDPAAITAAVRWMRERVKSDAISA
jgi:hypothetical protein